MDTQMTRWSMLCGMLVVLAGCARELPRDVRPQMDIAQDIRAALGSSGGSDAAVTLAEPTGFANFTGVFRVSGTPPVMPPVTVSGGDAGYCAPGGQAPLAQTVVVGPGGGFANVLIALDTTIPETWVHTDYEASREALLAGADGFDQKGCMFLSHVFAMRATQQVEVINSDAVSHNTNISAKGKARITNDVIPAGSKSIYAPGGASGVPFDISCNIHPWMKAYMFVADSPYFAVTDMDGKFEIKNLPAGVELTFKVWQEKISSKWDGATVNGAPVQWARGKFKLTLQPDQTDNWEVTVPGAMLN